MHAATMVTAGVYLIARLFPFYEEMAAEARTWIMWIGAITLFATGLLALVQNDIKRVLAYSTVSQLGYMVARSGSGRVRRRASSTCGPMPSSRPCCSSGRVR